MLEMLMWQKFGRSGKHYAEKCWEVEINESTSNVIESWNQLFIQQTARVSGRDAIVMVEVLNHDTGEFIRTSNEESTPVMMAKMLADMI